MIPEINLVVDRENYVAVSPLSISLIPLLIEAELPVNCYGLAQLNQTGESPDVERD